MRIATLLILLAAATASGCSYDPARISSKPLIIFDDDRGHYHDRDHKHKHNRHRQGGFCPPGQAKKGNC